MCHLALYALSWVQVHFISRGFQSQNVISLGKTHFSRSPWGRMPAFLNSIHLGAKAQLQCLCICTSKSPACLSVCLSLSLSVCLALPTPFNLHTATDRCGFLPMHFVIFACDPGLVLRLCKGAGYGGGGGRGGEEKKKKANSVRAQGRYEAQGQMKYTCVQKKTRTGEHSKLTSSHGPGTGLCAGCEWYPWQQCL